jgi:hypothetical protein
MGLPKTRSRCEARPAFADTVWRTPVTVVRRKGTADRRTVGYQRWTPSFGPFAGGFKVVIVPRVRRLGYPASNGGDMPAAIIVT